MADTLDQLLRGRVTRLLSLPHPARTCPVPVPPPARSVPGLEARLTLYRRVSGWVGQHHLGHNGTIARDLQRWIAAKGF